jgi:hypothetical protein
MPQRSYSLKRLFLFALSACLFAGAILEFQRIAWGTGVWLGQFALTWAVALVLFAFFCVLCLIVVWLALWAPHRLEKLAGFLSAVRERLGPARWILAVLFLLIPVYFLQYTFWGKVVHGPYLRLLMAAFSGILLGWALTRDRMSFITWPAGLAALVLISGTYALLVSLAEVTGYPFSLGWSEGNRLWDYSVLFGRHLYDYPADQPIPVLLDIGRQFIGGIPFLLPGLKIWQARLWLALVDVVPYLLLGWAAFRLDRSNILKWLLAGIWAFTFVRQGPIHPPLLICAIVVALVWERPLWLSMPLIAAASYFAEISRFTWLFAPGMWAVMLEMNRTVRHAYSLDRRAWARAIGVGAAGVFGGYAAPFWIPDLLQWARSIGETASAAPAPSPVVEAVASPGVTVEAVNASVAAQPLLWYRLLPNATYGEGILIGLALAAVPLIAILIYLSRSGRWKLDFWQKLSVVLPLLSFLVVGLIVSVKIGGGGDLHNLDMFIIGLMFAGAIAWRHGAFRWIKEMRTAPAWVQLMLVALIVIPGYKPLTHMTPLSINGDIATVATLADIVEDPLPNPLPDTLPSDEDTMKELEKVRRAVAQASQTGEVLFMDQRQLLTFGYIQDVPLVVDYDKKVLINKAMSDDARYFAGFYQDLAAQRFSLIITNPVNRRLDKSEGHFAEENNAWVKWVSTPLLCYYEPLDRLKRVDVELLAPRQDTSECEQLLPIQVNE